MTTPISNGNCPNVVQHEQTTSIISQNIFVTTIKTIMDIIIFLIVSIGYILQDIFYTIFGYPEKDLKPEIALVTGGGSGIGRQISIRLSEMGAKVVIWDINAGGIEETVKIIKELGGSCTGYVVDISKKEDVYKAADIVRKEVGDVTLLINNAGVVSGMLLLDTPDYLIERSFNVNVMAHFWTTKAFLPKMIENDHGHIVTIASLAGHVGIPKLVDYCSSKFAAVGFDEALRLELDVLGHQGVQTTCICPYFIQSTGMFGDVSARWVPTLNPNDVAERVLKAVKRNEKVAVIPGYIKILLSLKWMFPWGVVGGFLKRLVLDAAPHTNGITTATQTTSVKSSNLTNNNLINGDIKEKILDITSTASATTATSDVPKSASILVQRTTINKGERAL